MRAIKTTTISILALSLLAGSAVGVTAQDEEEFPPLVYFTEVTTGEPGRVVEPTVIEGELGWTMEGLELHDIPLEMGDPRISGNLSMHGQGAGGGPLGRMAS